MDLPSPPFATQASVDALTALVKDLHVKLDKVLAATSMPVPPTTVSPPACTLDSVALPLSEKFKPTSTDLVRSTAAPHSGVAMLTPKTVEVKDDSPVMPLEMSGTNNKTDKLRSTSHGPSASRSGRELCQPAPSVPLPLAQSHEQQYQQAYADYARSASGESLGDFHSGLELYLKSEFDCLSGVDFVQGAIKGPIVDGCLANWLFSDEEGPRRMLDHFGHVILAYMPLDNPDGFFEVMVHMSTPELHHLLEWKSFLRRKTNLRVRMIDVTVLFPATGLNFVYGTKSKTLFVRNLPPIVLLNESALATVFSPFQPITTEATNDGEVKVTFKDAKLADLCAKALEGANVCGSVIRMRNDI